MFREQESETVERELAYASFPCNQKWQKILFCGIILQQLDFANGSEDRAEEFDGEAAFYGT